MKHHIRVTLLTLLYAASHSRGKILRNNALMTKMISHFQQQDANALTDEDSRKKEVRVDYISPNQQEIPPDSQKPDKILNLMQSVLCRNFPSVPCNIIKQDKDLSKLISRSILQMNYKKNSMDRTTPEPTSRRGRSRGTFPVVNSGQHGTFPVVNSEDLSSFLEVSHTGYFDEKNPDNNEKKQKKRKKGRAEQKLKNYWSHEKPSKKKIKGSKDGKKVTEMYGSRKKMRKFYPHKIKHKDKLNKNSKGDFRDFTEEKVSMSIEVPEMNAGLEKKGGMSFDMESPVWRIDYMKHGVPSINTFGFEDGGLRGKLIRSGPGVASVNNDGVEEKSRKDVLHPDLYIKKNFVRKNASRNTDVLE